MLSTCVMFLSLPLSVYLKLLSDLMHCGVPCTRTGWAAGAASGKAHFHVFSPLIKDTHLSFSSLQSFQFSQNLWRPFLIFETFTPPLNCLWNGQMMQIVIKKDN